MNSSSITKKNKISPSVSFSEFLSNRREGICGLHSSSKLKHVDQIFNKLAKDTGQFYFSEKFDAAPEDNDEEKESAGEESEKSVCTERKLRRIKRKLFLNAAKATRVPAVVQGKHACPTVRKGKE